MAITISVGEERKDEPGIEIRMVNTCGQGPRPLYMQTTYVGCVLSLREMNGYDDSDFYATVWDFAEGRSKEIEYATTRGWTYENSARVDATEEVKRLYAEEQRLYREARLAAHEAELAKMPKPGQVVVVTKGRKLPKGTEGEVTWVGKDKFKEARRARYRNQYADLLGFHYYPDEYRVGLRLKDGTRVFVSAENIEIKEAA